MHLRNTLAKGMDAESYSLHTFEALLSQSMEDLGKIFKLTINIQKFLILSNNHTLTIMVIGGCMQMY